MIRVIDKVGRQRKARVRFVHNGFKKAIRHRLYVSLKYETSNRRNAQQQRVLMTRTVHLHRPQAAQAPAVR